jgi:hypothetical protein|nr:hypothetical protein [Kofleriaceae bacterium]
MRIIALVLLLAACDHGTDPIEQAKLQAAADDKARGADTTPAKKISPPVPGSQRIPCDQLLDAAGFQKALSEVELPKIVDMTKSEADAAASCSLYRGGKRPTDAEQKAMLHDKGKLGVMNGDELCNVSAFCWTIEDPDRFRKKCAETKNRQEDNSMGTFSCVQVVPTGEEDVDVFRFFDADTKCILQVRGGPSMTDNDYIRTCAKTARDLIGPAQIAVTPGAAPTKAAPTGSGSGS